MAAEAARVLEYPGDYFDGSAAPAYGRPAYDRPEYDTSGAALPREADDSRSHAAAVVRSAPAVSFFSVFGGAAAAVLMVFVLIANVRFHEISNERARLETQLSQLTQNERKLEIKYESVVDMKAVEQYARDVLGMSKPDTDQISVINRTPDDRAEVLSTDVEEEGLISGLGKFISSLTGYLKINS